LFAHALLPRNGPRPHLQVTFAVFIPFVAAWIEGSMDWPSETKSITNTIVIEASAEEIWPEIASVEAIPPEQIPERWIYWIGFPKPVAATLDHHGVGGVRIATFERDVSFFEEVTEWDKPRKLSFTIHADPEFIPQSAFDRHIIVGGRFYDVLDGTYEIEPARDGPLPSASDQQSPAEHPLQRLCGMVEREDHGSNPGIDPRGDSQPRGSQELSSVHQVWNPLVPA
jgi:hypothetical protein